MNSKRTRGEISKFGLKFIIIFVIIGFVSIFDRAFSYDTYVAHPNVVELAAQLYNEQADIDLTEKEIQLLRKGAVEEDMPPRWVNHFYDPIYNVGWESVYLKSKDWAVDPEAQRNYSLGDYSWQRAIYDYQQGNKRQALLALGHIIHLITDTSVPAHTRDDTHIEGDSYEQFVKYNWDILTKGLKNVDTSIIYFDNLDEHFNDLSVYTNSNFYSEGTIKSEKYEIIDEVGSETMKVDDVYKTIYISDNSVDNKNYYIYLSKRTSIWDLDTEGIFNKGLTLKHQLVLTSYAKHLIPKAIGHSAGIIKLFFEEVEKEHDFIPKEDRTTLKGKLAYLLGFTINKAHGLKTLVFGNRGIVIADENTVLNVMNEDGAQTEEEPEELEPALGASIEITPLSLVNESIIEINTDKEESEDTDKNVEFVPIEIVEEVIIPSTEKVLADDEDEKVFDDIKKDSQKSFTAYMAGGGAQNPLTSEPALVLEFGEESEDSEEEEQEDGEDEEIETPTSTEPIVDTDPPDVSDLNISLNISTSTTSTVNLSWGSVAEDLSYYELEYKIDSGQWQTLISQTTSTDYMVEVEQLKTYIFRARAVDSSENVSIWSDEESIFVDWTKAVVINEIAWMGTASNKSQDEWLELYNNTNQEVDLSGWSITISGKEINWDKSSSTIFTIEAYGYYLLERTNDDTVSNINADATYKGGLKNKGENLLLINNEGEVIDQVDNSDGWFAGSKEEKYRTMERINSNLSGNLESNWQTSKSISSEAETEDGGPIYGTPREPNMGYLYLEDLLGDYGDLFDENDTLTLTKENNPHIIDGVVEIPENYTLKIERGVILTGSTDDSYIDVKGNLIIEGTENEPVIFTSNKDVDYIDCELSDFLFDNERDCDALRARNDSADEDDEPQPGDWSRIDISSTGKLDANNVKFFYGGNEYFLAGGFVFGGNFPSRVISNLGGEVNLNNVLFENSFVPEDDKDDRGYDAIVWLESSVDSFVTTTINNSTFDGGYVAVKDNGDESYLEINDSNFSNFTSLEGVVVSRYNLPLLVGNVFEDNAKNAVYFQQIEINTDSVLDSGIEYTFGSITITSSSTLIINPGVVLNMGQRGSITVNGSLQSLGTADNPVKIQSLEQDKYWGNMLFNNSTSTLEYTNISGGNYGFVPDPDINGVLMLENSDVTLENVLLINARRPYNMVYARDSNLSISNSRISWTTKKASKSWSINGIKINGGYTYIDNTYFNEMDVGVEVYIGSTVEIDNMTSEHFTNISNMNWWPVDLLIFQ